MSKLIIRGTKVERVSEPTKQRTFWTARNVMGAAGIILFVAWALRLIVGGG